MISRSVSVPTVMCLLVSLASATRFSLSAADGQAGKPGPSPSGNSKVVSGQLMYRFEPGKVYHYKVVAIFSGQIPKLSEPGTDAHIRAELYYSAKAVKQDATGTSVAFAVEAENLSFLTKDPGPNGKLSADDVLPFPLPLAQVQGYLNVTALLKPDGTVASVTGGNNDPVKIDVGVDLRKLFVLMLPITMPDHAISPGITWNFDEGFLGKKPGRTVYTGKLDAVREDANRVAFNLSQVARTSVSDKLDKEGNSTADPKLQVGTITGDVSATGSMVFNAQKSLPDSGVNAKPGYYSGRLASGKMTLSVALKRTMPDPDHPEQTIMDPITVRGRMAVEIQAGPPKLDSSGALPDPGVTTGSTAK